MSSGTPSNRPDTVEPSAITIVASGDAEVALHHFGGEGPPLIISHATGFHARTYQPVIAALRSSFDVWGVDYRGHGHSLLDETSTFVWHDFADDLLAAVAEMRTQLRLDTTAPIVGLGHSMGATTILLAEQRKPGTFAAAWLFEPIVFPADVTPRNSMMAASARKRRSEFASRAAVIDRYASRAPLNRLRADALWSYVKDGFRDTADGAVTLACRPVHEALTFNGAKIQAADLGDVMLPVLIAQGETVSDQPSAADFALGTANALSNAEHRAYQHLGHFGPLETPDHLANDIIDWFREGGYCSR